MKQGVQHFVLASSSSVYGADAEVPYREEARTDRPLSPYAATKKMAEVLLYTFHYLYGLPSTVPPIRGLDQVRTSCADVWRKPSSVRNA